MSVNDECAVKIESLQKAASEFAFQKNIVHGLSADMCIIHFVASKRLQMQIV